LTGLSNRRKFTEDLERLITNDNTGAVLILDIDDFKNINDVQGHIYGDRVLQLVAQFLQKELDSCAKAYRFGGDEFLIIADGLDNHMNWSNTFWKRAKISVNHLAYIRKAVI